MRYYHSFGIDKETYCTTFGRHDDIKASRHAFARLPYRKSRRRLLPPRLQRLPDNLHGVRGIVSRPPKHFSTTESVHVSAKVPAFLGVWRFVLERDETRHLWANYTPGYFVVLPACGSRNDGLFINDLSLSARGRLPVVPRKSRA